MSALRASKLFRAVLAALLTTLGGCRAQSEEPPPAPPREELIQELFGLQDAESLAAAIAKARANGLPEQAILEARFLFLVDQGDFGAVAKLTPELVKQKEQFRIEDSVIFSVPEEFFAIIEYSRALGALEEGDHAAFKQHITEAFWLSPRQAAAFAPHIERLRLDQAMAKVTVDFHRRYPAQSDGKPVALESVAGDAPHLLVHFWSPWSAECEAFLPDFVATARELARHNIAVASILAEPSDDALVQAREFRQAIKADELGAWLVDNSEDSLAHTLRVQDLPTVALLTSEGKVLFNGHPADNALWESLRNVAPDIQRPRLDPPVPAPEHDRPE